MEKLEPLRLILQEKKKKSIKIKNRKLSMLFRKLNKTS